MNNRFYIILALSFFLFSCYPLTTGSRKWRIKWDKDQISQKVEFLKRNKKLTKDNPPNVVVIVADDLGKSEVSAYGSRHMVTPNIDAIAKEGVLFTEGYVTSPTCAPSRAALLTGRYQNRFGFETQIMEFYPTNMIEYLTGKYIINSDNWVVKSKPVYPREWQIHRQGLPPTEINLAEILQNYGYATGISGKWHLGVSKHHIPNNRGFDEQYGFYGAFSRYSKEKEESGIINYIHDDFSSKYQWNSGRREHGALFHNNNKIEEEEYLTFAIKDRAIEFIQKNKDRPFFLYCSFSAPHLPFQAPVDNYCRYEHVEDENKRVYYAMISALDDAVGEIHQSIKEFGIEENTIIYFISDNGGATYTKATDNGILKGGKLTQFEGGIQVPFMMKWKGQISPGAIYDKPVLSTDIFTTSVLNAGGTLPEDRVYDGVNLMDYLQASKKTSPHQNLFWRADHIWAIRDGDYKMILSVRDGWAELYNIKKDASESINLKEEMNELYHVLRTKHLEWQEELPKRPMWPRVMDYRFVIDGKEYLFPA